MRLSNKSTFSLACLILLFAFATMPVMANTMSAEWSADLEIDNDDTTTEPGWEVTLTFATAPTAANAPDTADFTATGATVASLAPTSATDPAVTDTDTEFTFDLSLGTDVAGHSNDAEITLTDGAGVNLTRRVTFTNGQDLASTSIYLPQLVSITAPKSSNGTSTIEATIKFAAPADPVEGPPAVAGIGPATGLKASDVSLTAGTGTVVSVTMDTTNSNVYMASILLTATTEVSLAAAFPHNVDAATGDASEDNTADVVFDNVRPTIGDIEFLSLVQNRALDPTDVDEVFDVTVADIADTPTGDFPTGVADLPLTVRFSVTPDTRGASQSEQGKTQDGKHVVRLTPNSNPTTTDWPATPIRITVTVTDTAGNVATKFTDAVTLAAREGVDPLPPSPATIPNPALGETTAGATLTITFSKNPGTVTAAGNTLAGSGPTRTFTAAATAGSHTLALSWTGTDAGASDNGTGTVTYTIPRGFVSSNPTSPSNIRKFMIPANSYLVLVRDKNAMTAQGTSTIGASFSFPQVDGNNVAIEEWPEMPDLEVLFNRSSFGQGGVLVLRRSADARDNDNAEGTGMYATPAVGSVGISEIMWGLDLGQVNRDHWEDSQWIELHNLNSKPVNILIYAQQGRESGLAANMQLIRDGFVQRTLAGDEIVKKTGGGLAGMVVDAVTNINNKGDGREAGWDPKGDNGNSVTGDALTSMHRILPGGQPAYSAAQNYTKRDGRNKDSWAAASNIYAVRETRSPGSQTTVVVVTTNYNGTPGQRNDYTGVTLYTKKPTTNLPDSPALIFNEIGNRATSDKRYEWIEIRNTTGSAKSLKAYRITMLTAVGTETILIDIPHNQAADVPANGVLLLLASDPDGDPDHPLSVGYNIDEPAEDQEPGSNNAHVPRYKVVDFRGDGIPNGGFILVLRAPHDAAKNHRSGIGADGRVDVGGRDLHKIVDLAGHSTNLSKSINAGGYPNPVSETSLWPLHSFPASHGGNNITDDRVWQRRRVNSKGNDLLGAGHWDGSSSFGPIGYTGIGYRRDVPRENRYGGDPGYHNPQVNVATSVTGDVIISELMLSTGSSDSRKLPQWIEITNNSGTKAINLRADAGWRLVIETPNDAIRTINFKDWDHGSLIYPKQTILIVAGTPTRNAQAGSDRLPTNVIFKDDRVFNVVREYGNGFTKMQLDPDNPRDLTDSDRFRFLHPKQFHMKLIDGRGNVADVVGNLDGEPRTNDTADWEYPSGLTKEGFRSSFIRVFDDGTARTAVGSDADDVLPLNPVGSGAVDAADLEFNDYGSVIPAKYAWIHAAVINFNSLDVRHTWYGSENDAGTPGVIKGQPLPVSLSFFRPTLEDGKVVIRWTTESELDNAGFNILRSDSRNGEFVQVNEELIDGKGTTAERSTYKWIDPSAKPGVVYYYQIEDVSFAGERTRLTTTKLKGLISAKNKVTTTWSELKEIQ